MKRHVIRALSVLMLVSLLLGIFGLAVSASSNEGGASESGELLPAFRLRRGVPHLEGKRGFRIFELLPKKKRSSAEIAIPSSLSVAEGLVTNQEEEMDAARSSATLPEALCPGGSVFGVRLFLPGVLVVGVGEDESVHPAYDAGIRVCDLIVEIDGKAVTRTEDVSRAIHASSGSAIQFVCMRDGNRLDFSVTPSKEGEDGQYKAGITIRDNAAGIGTVTYYDPKTGAFGGLGHGICDPDTGKLVPLARGTVTGAEITDIVKGKAGKPGELRGHLEPEKKGALLSNTECGVFGVLSPAPKEGTPIPLLPKAELKEGEATLVTSLGEEQPQSYKITVSAIDRTATGSKCFAISVCDQALIAKTGGIVQGMSGSPIIQDGKLAGAVTHVMVGDPTRGYGIFIENMLNSM